MLEKLFVGGALAIHIITYKEELARIFGTFAVTFVLKKILQGSGNKTHSDLVAIAGYCLTGVAFFAYLTALLHNAIPATDPSKLILPPVPVAEPFKGLIPPM